MRLLTVSASLLASASVFALGDPAFAQASPGASKIAGTTPPATTVDEIQVTGSRIVRDGFQSPTPVTVLTAQELATRSPGNIPDAVNQLPQFVRSYSQYTGKHTSTNTPVGNFLNLRGLGVQRSLILLDGLRVPPTSYDGGVDINTLPQYLIERVDVVTGGASAAYGSDAVVGVVNFVLNKKFEGLKATAQVGQSRYSDATSYKIAVAGGRAFLQDRLHVEFSAEHYDNEGIDSRNSRPPHQNRYVLTGAGTAANPYTLSSDVRYNSITYGGLIRSGPLTNFTFNPDGTISPFDRGTPTGSSGLQTGGGGAYFPDGTLVASLRTDQTFARVSYDATPGITFYAQTAFAESRNKFNGASQFNFAPGSAAITIFSENAFLDPAVRTELGATPSFLLARMANDFPPALNQALNDSWNSAVGVEGKFGDGWSWNASYARGDSKLRGKANEGDNIKLFAAADAVRDTSGNIVCRVAITDPGRYPGCVPINLFGEGAPSAAAIAYVMGQAQYQVDNSMDIWAANVQGDPFSLWAGPVTVAAGVEYRRQKLVQTSNNDIATPPDATGIRGVPANTVRSSLLNMGTAFGKVNVKEIYGEVVVPLAQDMPLLRKLELNGAIRYTDYSTSGSVTTWKVGINYEPTDELRLRATVSRDIRAPSLYQLYAGGQIIFINFVDPHTSSANVVGVKTAGNPALTPEIGSMTVGGFVYTPKWLPGFMMSLDAYGILITDAIAQTSAGQQAADCEASNGSASVCDLISRPNPFSDRSVANFPTSIRVAPQNLSKIYQVGYDFESGYHLPLEAVRPDWDGALDFRLLLSYTPTVNTKLDAKSPTQRSAGYFGNPKLKGNFLVDYRNGPLYVGAQMRMTGRFKLPTAPNTQVYRDHGYAPNVVYTDLSASYKFNVRDHEAEAFITVNNLFDRSGPLRVDIGQGNPGLSYPTLREYYDLLGRYVTIGTRLAL